MQRTIEGHVKLVGHNIDTDQIYPGRYLAITDPQQIGKHCMEGVDENFSVNFPPGGIVVAGRNFGCGSSREHAPIALLNMGASAVVAESFARIFYRNAINLGLPLIVCKGINEKLKEDQSISIDILNGTITITETGETFQGEKLGDQALMILEAGGIKPLMKERFAKG